MKKSIVLDELKPVDIKKIHPYGENSSAILIPKPILDRFKLGNGSRLMISIDEELKMIVLSRPEDLTQRDSGSFHLKISKKEFKKLSNK